MLKARCCADRVSQGLRHIGWAFALGAGHRAGSAEGSAGAAADHQPSRKPPSFGSAWLPSACPQRPHDRGLGRSSRLVPCVLGRDRAQAAHRQRSRQSCLTLIYRYLLRKIAR